MRVQSVVDYSQAQGGPSLVAPNIADPMSSSSPQPPLLPPSLDYTLSARRRSQSSSGSYRTSLGGKPIGPKYHGVGNGTRKSSSSTASAAAGMVEAGHGHGHGQSHHGVNHGNHSHVHDSNSSRISLGSSSAYDSSDELGSGGLHHRMGAFSHTRDEIRDSKRRSARFLRVTGLIPHSLLLSAPSLLTGTARLASLSLVVPSPLTSPALERDRPKLLPSAASAPAATPAHTTPSSPTLDTSDQLATPRPPLPSGKSLHPSPPSAGIASNLSLARPSSPIQRTDKDDATRQQDSATSTTASSLDAKRFSPSTSSSGDDGLTPTQSTMGSFKPAAASSAGADLSEGTTASDSPQASPPQVRALGDETGGVPSDEEEDRLVEEEIRRERQNERLETKKRQKSMTGAERPAHVTLSPVDERTSLLPNGKRTTRMEQVVGKQRLRGWRDRASNAVRSTKHHFAADQLRASAKNGVQSLPAVVLG